MFGRAVKCINASNGDVERAAYTAEPKFGDAEMARECKALSSVSLSGCEKCDYCVALPLKGKVNSLNASVALGIAVYEIQRRR